MLLPAGDVFALLCVWRRYCACCAGRAASWSTARDLHDLNLAGRMGWYARVLDCVGRPDCPWLSL